VHTNMMNILCTETVTEPNHSVNSALPNRTQFVYITCAKRLIIKVDRCIIATIYVVFISKQFFGVMCIWDSRSTYQENE